MARKYISRKLLLILITLLVAICLAVLYYLRDISNTYYFVSLKTDECVIDKSSPECKLSVIHLETGTGDDVYFYYNKSTLRVENNTGKLSGFTYNEKVQVTTKGNSSQEIPEISDIRQVKLF